MGSDTPARMPRTPGNSMSVSLSGDDEAELRGYFRDLTPAPPIMVGRDGQPEIEVDAVIGHDLLRPYR